MCRSFCFTCSSIVIYLLCKSMKKLLVLLTICSSLSFSSCGTKAHTHKWGVPTYTWASDYSTCSAKRVCQLNKEHVESETSESTYKVVVDPTEEAEGLGRYTVNFVNPAFTSQIVDVNIDKLPPSKDEYEVIENISKRMPAEFEPVSMIKMCYPNNMPLSAYKTIAEDNKVLILTNRSNKGSSRISEARTAFINAGVKMDNVTFIDMDIDYDYTYWVRDFSPFYVFNDLDLSIVDFTYNRDRPEQNSVPSKLATYFDMSYSKMNLVHTGGNLMQDGRFTAFSDDLVVQENSYSESKVKSQMKEYCGTDNYVITIDPQGDYIAHIDCWGKIVAPDKIIVAKFPATSPRYDYYESVATILGNLNCIYGYKYRIYRIEEPGGNTVAPYTNSLIANGHVYMPLGTNSTYNQKALKVYEEALPGYEVHGIEGYSQNEDCAFLNTDALHCRTHEVPDDDMLFIDTREVVSGTVSLASEYLVKTNIVSYANEDISEVSIYYSINGGAYQKQAMSKYQETNNYTYTFSNLNKGDEVKYYIEASDTSNNKNVDPTCGKLDPHTFTISS